MTILNRFPEIMEEAKRIWERTMHADLEYAAAFDGFQGEDAQAPADDPVERDSNRIIISENLAASKTMLAAIRAETMKPFRLIYMDPPFFSRRQYKAVRRIKIAEGEEISLPQFAFHDLWLQEKGGEEGALVRYLTMLTARVIAARELLAEEGCLWLHLDHHAVHYVKVLADAVFGGPGHLSNEIIWKYKSGGSSTRRFSRKHDTLLYYVKTPGRQIFHPLAEKSYNRDRKPYRFKGVKEYQDEGGWYTMVNMKDVWQIDMVGRTSGERTGYATQKPEELLSRIIQCCTEEGDSCGDLFGGSGSLAAAAEKLGRRWTSVDENPMAAWYAEQRLTKLGARFELLIRTREDEADEEEKEGRTKSDASLPGCDLRLKFKETTAKETLSATLEILRYDPPASTLPSDAELRSRLQEISRRKPHALVCGQALDLKYDGHIFTPGWLAYGEERLEILLPRKEPNQRGGSIAVRITDIFGNTMIRRLEPAEIEGLPKEKIMVSACLYGGKRVRYDGGTCLLADPRFLRWKEEGRLTPFCPEVAGGLPVPRSPAERKGDQIINADGVNVTKAFQKGAEAALAEAQASGVRLAILKECSPSCGVRRIHDGSFTGAVVAGEGLTTKTLRAAGFQVFSEEELDAVSALMGEDVPGH